MRNADKVLNSCVVGFITAFILMTVIGVLLKVFLPISPEENPWFILFYIFGWLLSISLGILKGRSYWKKTRSING